MVTILPPDASTDREWNFRDDNAQHFFGDIPADQEAVTLTLNWKPDGETDPREVGRYLLNMRELLRAGYVRESPKGVLLRFQRDGDFIEIAVTRVGPALVVGRRPAASAIPGTSTTARTTSTSYSPSENKYCPNCNTGVRPTAKGRCPECRSDVSDS
jgi:hypothetical protein